ncbi:L-lactate dehydrogenase [Cutaneotrichosporon oleaginosum]|uniref:L-lactate dehydrogenase (cytochrome) n=1 Tax=Cutaneotrichosporon oleaginosum TaxID=879819 RepID=A0A0J0XMR1_9TREE|nr:L-lactate dehydrogenase [Cutaneotrichosporon oleaginosum]KLT42383.1 L-lactate dehydrogenase [Cutaneotrichosporon oleaginosum]TXT04202.1 hypothetical protein COLE_07899 [Cutaneotrichosporon oleaginosum]
MSLPRARLALRLFSRALQPRGAAQHFSSSSSGLRRSSSHQAAFSYRHAAVVGGGALVLGATLYFTTWEVQLDAPHSSKLIPYAEVQKHNTPNDCWVVIGDKVYDLTKFANIHPGGTGPIHKVAGADATVIFEPIHSPGIIADRLEPSACVGPVDPGTLPPRPVIPEVAQESGVIPLDEIIGLPDFHEAGRRNMSSKAWSYISAGATDEYSLDLNRRAWNWVLFRPRVLVDVAEVDTRTSLMGCETSLPVFIAPTGMSKLAGMEGEPGLAAAAGECDIVQMISTNASASLEATVGAASAPQIMQLYVNKDRANSEALLRKVTALGLRGVVVTVDCASPGKREADERNRATVEVASGLAGGAAGRDKKGGGVGRTTGAYIDPRLKWDDIAWIRQHTSLPIGVKGVQCVEDAVRCADMGVDAIYLSNHGGRALDTSPPALYTLLELRRLRPDVLERCEVYVDGGVRRGTDVVKALCLGARGVGLGRPFLYALTYGKEGVVHAIDILRDEIEVTMKLLGVTRLDQLGPHLLNTKALDPLVIDKLEYGPQEGHFPK